ncbi:conserved Plasmodium protein, unknown function [Plasmodium malariae]|uniref:Uncharacterized protein n=1 Tax=Plasmodium malariae TaxID=5858 RepID=A0A1C3KB79_PLAMA|nr:conserved Plasmodium protein, unknown function [Plasmodium malariae]
MIYLTSIRSNDFYFKHYDVESLLETNNKKIFFLNNLYISNNSVCKKKKFKKKNTNSHLLCVEDDKRSICKGNNKNGNKDSVNYKRKQKIHCSRYLNNGKDSCYKCYNEANYCCICSGKKKISNKVICKVRKRKNISNKCRKQNKCIVLLNKKNLKKQITINEKKNNNSFHYINWAQVKKRCEKKMKIKKNTQLLQNKMRINIFKKNYEQREYSIILYCNDILLLLKNVERKEIFCRIVLNLEAQNKQKQKYTFLPFFINYYQALKEYHKGGFLEFMTYLTHINIILEKRIYSQRISQNYNKNLKLDTDVDLRNRYYYCSICALDLLTTYYGKIKKKDLVIKSSEGGINNMTIRIISKLSEKSLEYDKEETRGITYNTHLYFYSMYNLVYKCLSLFHSNIQNVIKHSVTTMNSLNEAVIKINTFLYTNMEVILSMRKLEMAKYNMIRKLGQLAISSQVLKHAFSEKNKIGYLLLCNSITIMKSACSHYFFERLLCIFCAHVKYIYSYIKKNEILGKKKQRKSITDIHFDSETIMETFQKNIFSTSNRRTILNTCILKIILYIYYTIISTGKEKINVKKYEQFSIPSNDDNNMAECVMNYWYIIVQFYFVNYIKREFWINVFPSSSNNVSFNKISISNIFYIDTNNSYKEDNHKLIDNIKYTNNLREQKYKDYFNKDRKCENVLIGKNANLKKLKNETNIIIRTNVEKNIETKQKENCVQGQMEGLNFENEKERCKIDVEQSYSRNHNNNNNSNSSGNHKQNCSVLSIVQRRRKIGKRSLTDLYNFYEKYEKCVNFYSNNDINNNYLGKKNISFLNIYNKFLNLNEYIYYVKNYIEDSSILCILKKNKNSMWLINDQGTYHMKPLNFLKKYMNFFLRNRFLLNNENIFKFKKGILFMVKINRNNRHIIEKKLYNNIQKKQIIVCEYPINNLELGNNVFLSNHITHKKQGYSKNRYIYNLYHTIYKNHIDYYSNMHTPFKGNSAFFPCILKRNVKKIYKDTQNIACLAMNDLNHNNKVYDIVHKNYNDALSCGIRDRNNCSSIYNMIIDNNNNNEIYNNNNSNYNGNNNNSSNKGKYNNLYIKNYNILSTMHTYYYDKANFGKTYERTCFQKNYINFRFMNSYNNNENKELYASNIFNKNRRRNRKRHPTSCINFYEYNNNALKREQQFCNSSHFEYFLIKDKLYNENQNRIMKVNNTNDINIINNSMDKSISSKIDKNIYQKKGIFMYKHLRKQYEGKLYHINNTTNDHIGNNCTLNSRNDIILNMKNCNFKNVSISYYRNYNICNRNVNYCNYSNENRNYNNRIDGSGNNRINNYNNYRGIYGANYRGNNSRNSKRNNRGNNKGNNRRNNGSNNSNNNSNNSNNNSNNNINNNNSNNNNSNNDDNERENNDSNKKDSISERKNKNNKRKKKGKKSKKIINYRHKNINKRIIRNSKHVSQRKKKNIVLKKGMPIRKEKKIGCQKNTKDILNTNNTNTKKEKTNMSMQNIKGLDAENGMNNCNSLKRYINYLKNLDYDIKFGNVYVKLKKKLSSQNKCQFEVYEAEIVAVDTICNLFYPYIQKFENFYNILKKSTNNYDFLKISMNNYEDSSHFDISESNLDDFMNNSEEFNVILNYLINSRLYSGYNNNSSSKNVRNSKQKKRNYFSYVNLPENILTNSLNKEFLYPMKGEYAKKIDSNNNILRAINENIDVRKRTSRVNGTSNNISNNNSNNRVNDMYTSSLVNMNYITGIYTKPEEDGVIYNSLQTNNYLFNSAQMYFNTSLIKGWSNDNSIFLNNKNMSKSCSIIKKEKEFFFNYKEDTNNNFYNNNNGPMGGKFSRRPNFDSTTNYNKRNRESNNKMVHIYDININHAPHINDYNIFWYNHLLWNKQQLARNLIHLIKKMNFLKYFGYKSLYDILKEEYKKYVSEKMIVESNTLFNILRHISRYNYINDVINNPFTIYQSSIKNMPSNKFAIKILNINACNIYKLKYKIHSLLSEGKQLEKVNLEIWKHDKKKHFIQENINGNLDKITQMILQKNKKCDQSLLTLNHCSSLSNNQLIEYYQELCKEEDSTNITAKPCLSDILNIKELIKNNETIEDNKEQDISPNYNSSFNNIHDNKSFNNPLSAFIRNSYNSVDNDSNNNINNNDNNSSNNSNNNNSQNRIKYSSNNKLAQLTNEGNSSNVTSNNVFPFVCKYCLNIFYDKDIMLTDKKNKDIISKSIFSVYCEKNSDTIMNNNNASKYENAPIENVNVVGDTSNLKNDKQTREIKCEQSVNAKGKSKKRNSKKTPAKKGSSSSISSNNINNTNNNNINTNNNNINNINNNINNNNRNINNNIINSNNNRNINNNNNKNNSDHCKNSRYIQTRSRGKNARAERKQKQNGSNQGGKTKNTKVSKKCAIKKETKLKVKNVIINKKRRGINLKKGKNVKSRNKNNCSNITTNEKQKEQNENVSTNPIPHKFIDHCALSLLPGKKISCKLVPHNYSASNSTLQNLESYNDLFNNCISHNTFNFNINNFKKLKMNVCRKCEEKNLQCEKYITKESKETKKKKKHLTSIPKYLWSSVGMTKNNEHVLGVAMQMIDGCTLTYIIQKLKGTENVNYGLFLLDICKKLVKHLMIICESIDNPIINWDTKPGNIMVEYELVNSKISCKNVTIIDVGDALPGRSFYFPTNPSYYEKIRINNVQKNFNNFLYYVICTKGYCSPECALLVFLLSSLNKSEQFRKTWYGADSNLYHINKTKQLRIKHRWKKLLDLRFIQPILKKRDNYIFYRSSNALLQKCACMNSWDNNIPIGINKNNDNNINNDNSNNNNNNNKNNSSNIKTSLFEKNGMDSYLFCGNKNTNQGEYINLDPCNGHYSSMNNYKNRSNNKNLCRKFFDNRNNASYNNSFSNYDNMNSKNLNSEKNCRRYNSSNNTLCDNANNLHGKCTFNDAYAAHEINENIIYTSMESGKFEKKLQNEGQDDILKDYYLTKVCTHDMVDDNLKEHYSDHDEIKEYLYNKDAEIKEMEIKLNECEKKKRKKREYEYYKMLTVDTWIIKFTTKTTIFSTGLVLCQLFGGHNLLNIVNKNEIKVVDVLCEWNCKNSTNVYSGEQNITFNELLPNKGIFSNDIWKSKIKKIIKKCLQFIPSRRCSFKELYIDIKNLKKEYEAYYNLNDDSTAAS